MSASLVVALLVCFASFIRIKSDPPPSACYGEYGKQYKFCDTSLSIDARVRNLISLLTVDEKAVLLTARESPSNAIWRLGIPPYDYGTNCIHSVVSRCGSYCSTLFPEPNALGATWNRSLIYNISVAIGLEMRALWAEGVGENHPSNLPHIGLDCWGPTINIGRDPRWGRMYEVISEDPYWNGVYGTMFTLGLQNGSTQSAYHDSQRYLAAATLKHFAAYSLGGYQSFTFNAVVSPYMFADTYFPAFSTVIKDANPRSVMCSYNAVNGIPACLDSWLLNSTLRQQFGFNGYIASDSGAISAAHNGHNYTQTLQEAVIDALNATCNINSGHGSFYATGHSYGTGYVCVLYACFHCFARDHDVLRLCLMHPLHSSPYTDNIPQLLEDNIIPESWVDDSLYYAFRMQFELGLFDQPVTEQVYFNIPPTVINNPSHQELNLLATHQAMTLLKNDKNTLPFDPTDDHTVYAIIGPHYNATTDLLIVGGYTGEICRDGSYDCVPGVINGIERYIDSNNILYAEGCNGVTCNSTAGFANASKVANEADKIILMMGLNQEIEKEGIDRSNISLPGYQQLLASQICNIGKPTVLVLVNGGICAIDELKYECPSILEVWYPGMRGTEAIGDTLFGANNPGGKMPVTMYWSNFTQYTDWHSMDLTAPPYGRTYKYWSGVEPLYPFAWGLSYTQFEFQFVNESSKGCTNGNVYCVEITNVGDRAGHETIFVFIIPPGNSTISSNEPASKMKKKLVEFDKTYLEKGESCVFAWTFDKSSDLMLFDVNGKATLFPGLYRILLTNGVHQNLYVNVDCC